MKKITIIFAFVLLCLPGSLGAQEKTAKERLKEIEEMTVNARKHRGAKSGDLFTADALAHFGFGFHQVSGVKELKAKFFQSHEIYLNTIQLGFHPASWLSLETGLDLKWDVFYPQKDYQLALDNDNDYGFNDLVLAKNESLDTRTKSFSLALPVTLGFHAPWFSFKAGAEFDFNLEKYTVLKTHFETDKYEYDEKDYNAKLEKFCYNFLAAVDFDGLGIYFRYYPKSILPDKKGAQDPLFKDMKYWTLGLCFSF